MSTLKSKAITWSIIASLMMLAMPIWILADDSGTPQNIEQLKLLRQVQNQSTVVKNLQTSSKQVNSTPDQARAMRLSQAMTKFANDKKLHLETSHRINFKSDDRQLPQAPQRSLRDVSYGNGVLSGHPDSLYFNFLTGENSSDSIGMDVRITGNEGTNFGNEGAGWGDPSLLYFFNPTGSLDDIDMVHTIDDPMQSWATVSWDNPPAGNGYQPLAVGNIWVVYTRTSHMYVAFEVTNVNTWGQYFEFNYMIQTDGSPLFGEPSLVDIFVNGQHGDTLEIGSNPYVEIFLDSGVSGEFAVIWDGNHNGMLDDSDVGLEYYGFMDNDLNDEDGTAGIFGFTYSDEMADGLNYFASDLLFVGFTDMGMAVAPVQFYSVATPFSVSGSIYQDNGGGPPLEGIVVWASYAGENNDGPDIIGVTDASGQYHLDLPDTGMVYIGSEDHFDVTEGLIPVPNMHMTHVLGHETGYNFYYQVPASAIEGMVADENGTPVEGVEVTAHADNGPGFSAFTDESGFYSMGVMLGEYDVEIEWQSLPGPYVIPYSEHIWVGDFAVATVNFTLHNANNTISGMVLLDSAPYPGAFIGATNELGYSVSMSSADGTYSLLVFGGSETTYDLHVFNNDSENIIQVSNNWDIPAGSMNEDIYLETVAGGLHGYFVNGSTMMPILDGNDMGMGMYNMDTEMEFYSGPNEDGYYQIHVPAGTYEVMAGGMNWMGPEPFTITITDSLIYRDMILTHIEYDASLGGHVYDSNGSPIPFAQVQVGNDGWGMGTEADASGYYYFELPRGMYHIGSWAPGFYDYYDEIIVSEGTNYYDFYLNPFIVDGAIAGQVYDLDSGMPISNANVFVYGEENGYMYNTDMSGEFWFDLPNGNYGLIVDAMGYPPVWENDIEVQNDTTFLQISMEMPDGGVEGYVYDGDGYPLSNAEVVIVSIVDSTGYWGYTDDYGYYNIPAFNGDYYITAWADGFNPSQPSAFSINDAWLSINIWLERREFATAPQINFIVDQPYDQGRWVRMEFWPGGTEWGPFTGYSIWRLTNTPMGPIVDFVDYLPNHDMNVYNVVLPTLVDSSAMVSDPLQFMSGFIVTGHWDVNGYIDGEPGAGYSVDNIHPGVPSPLTLLSSTEAGVEIGWEASMDDDFQYFEVYRADNPDFGDASMTPTIESMYTDVNVTVGQTYYYMVKAVDANGNMSEGSNIITTSIVSVDDILALPTAYGLSQNYPNPFNPTTSIEFALPQASVVSLEVYNLLGQKVRTLISGYVAAGYINTTWDGLDQNGKDLGSGTYIYRLQTGDMSFTKKMILMK